MIDIHTMDIHNNGHIEKTDESIKERHSGDIQEIITKVPSWIVRWGIMIFFAILLMAFSVSIIIKYPDTVKGRLKIESSEILKPGINPRYGRISKVVAIQGAIVKTGQPLMYLTQSDSDHPVALTATQDGILSYEAIVQPSSVLQAGQEVFTIHPMHEEFFGIMEIPAAIVSKLKVGQTVLITTSDNTEKLTGTVSYIAGEPTKAGVFLLKVSFANSNDTRLKSWVTFNAEIITQDATVFSRITKSILKSGQ